MWRALVLLLVTSPSWGCVDDAPREAPADAAVDAVPFLYGDGRYGFVRGDGSPVGDARFAALDVFHQGLAAAHDGGGWGFLTPALRWQVPPRYARVGPFVDGHAVAHAFEEPWLGPIMGLVLKQGTLTTDVIDRRGVVVSREVRRQNYLPGPAERAPADHVARFSVRAGPDGKVGVVDGADNDKFVLPPRFVEVQIIDDVATGVTAWLAARDDWNGRWSVCAADGAVVAGGFIAVHDRASAGLFVAAAGDNGWYGAYDARGAVVAPIAYEGFVFDGGLAETHVADVGNVWVKSNGTIYADLAYIKERHARVGRAP